MVFVTEDFSASKQVKLDNPAEAENDRIPIMKLNNLRRFKTGIYDYSMMRSVFTPVDLKKYPKTLKLASTSQDWCGQSFIQLNLKGEKYKVSQYSYFESESDQTYDISADFLEDELFTLIRLAPEYLTEGNYDVIPSAFYSRLMHDPLKPKQARITLDKQAGTTYLILEYLHLERTLEIGFESDFPHKILSWRELQNGDVLSKGKIKASIKSAYWRQHDNKHDYLRDSLKMIF